MSKKHSWWYDKSKYNYVTSEFRREIREAHNPELKRRREGIESVIAGIILALILIGVILTLCVLFLPKGFMSSPIGIILILAVTIGAFILCLKPEGKNSSHSTTTQTKGAEGNAKPRKARHVVEREVNSYTRLCMESGEFTAKGLEINAFVSVDGKAGEPFKLKAVMGSDGAASVDYMGQKFTIGAEEIKRLCNG
jgi:uncharacterized integral membrane protein